MGTRRPNPLVIGSFGCHGHAYMFVVLVVCGIRNRAKKLQIQKAQYIGDDQAGFSVEERLASGVYVAGWGFWSINVAMAFESVVHNACLVARRGTSVTFDMSNLKPMREESQRAFGGLLISLLRSGISKISVVTTNPLIRLQLVKLATEMRLESTIQWVSDAKQFGRYS